MEKDFYKNLAVRLEQYDISLLVNNVGLGGDSRVMISGDHDGLHETVTVNCTNSLLMTKIFLERALKRNKKCGHIELSSISSTAPYEKRELYSATKMFNRRWGQCLIDGYGDKLDVLILRPGYAKTALTGQRNVDYVTCLPEEPVEAAMKALGNLQESFGHVKHVIFGNIIGMIHFFVPFELAKAVIRKVHAGFKSKA